MLTFLLNAVQFTLEICYRILNINNASKFRIRNHNLRIKRGRFSIRKTPKDLGEGDIGGVLKDAILKKKNYKYCISQKTSLNTANL